MLQETTLLSCPYCGESFDINVDCSAGDQAYIEDCQVCCRPIELQIKCTLNGNFDSLIVRRDDD